MPTGQVYILCNLLKTYSTYFTDIHIDNHVTHAFLVYGVHLFVAYDISLMLMRQNINNDVNKYSPIVGPEHIMEFEGKVGKRA